MEAETAFPTDESNYEKVWSRPGMTLRDYFAAKAMAAYIPTAGAPCIVGGLDGAENELANQAYKMADAMLRSRGQ